MTEILLKNGSPGVQPTGHEQESLYERFPWPYAFCRNHLFRDDTEKIVAALWPAGIPSRAESLLEVGCGPGFYARGLAARFEHLRVTGIDLSARQLHRARSAARQLANCSFEKGDVLALGRAEASVDAVVASRLFMILSEREQALSEAHLGVTARRTLLCGRAALCLARCGAAPRHVVARRPIHLQRQAVSGGLPRA